MVLRQSKETKSEKRHLMINKDCRKKINIPSEIKGKESLEAFKSVIKNDSQKTVHVDCANVIYLELDLSNTRLQLPITITVIV